MAKGFKVKTVAPKTKAPEWDIDAIKARMKGKAIVFCLPGRGTSYIFLKNFVQLCFDMVQNGMSIQISQDYSSMVNFARCKVLGANVLRGPKQIPWDGKLKYDYQLWIDSDIVFDTNKFWQLCDLALPADGKEKEITAGWYATEDGSTTSIAHWLEEDDFRKNGGVMNHETVETMSKRKKPLPAITLVLVGCLLRMVSSRNWSILGLLLRCKFLSQVMYKICVEKTYPSV